MDVPTKTAELKDRLSIIGRSLREAVRSVLNAVPGEPRRPLDLARALGLNKDLASRILSAVQKRDDLAVTHFIPGPAPLREFFRAAIAHSVDKTLVRAAEDVVREFDTLIRTEAGDRAALDAVISAWLPEARERFETGAKQAMFRGSASIKGVMAETALTTILAHPSADPNDFACDGVAVCSLIGLRRLRPEAVVQITDVAHAKTTSLRRDSRAVDQLGGPLLEQFCTQPLPEIRLSEQGDRVHYLLGDHAVGLRAAVDITIAQVFHGMLRRFQRPGEHRKRFTYANVEQPAKTLYFDMLLHEDIWPGQEPELRIYDTTTNGVADPNDPGRDVDLLDVSESIQPLGQGLARFRISGVPNYTELLEFVCQGMGWNGAAFRAYRCRIQYPFYGSQVCMLFDPPPAPA
jgi:hypothetical protein